jgi:hypothetical protein
MDLQLNVLFLPKPDPIAIGCSDQPFIKITTICTNFTGCWRAVTTIYCTQPPHEGETKLFCPQHKGAGSPHPIRVGGPDLWYQMALVDTTVEQSGPGGREYVQVGGGSPRGGQKVGWKDG